MKHKGLYLLCFLILPILLLTTFSAYAVSNPIGQPSKSVEAKIEKYGDRDLDRYRPWYDKKTDWNPVGDEEIAQGINNATNFFFNMTKIMVSTTDYAITELYNLDVIDDFANEIGQFVSDIYTKLLDNLAMTLFIILCFNAFIIFSVQGNGREALKRGFLIFCLIGFGVGILANASPIIKGTNSIGKEINNIVLNSTTAINGDVDYVNKNSGMNKIRNQYFNMTIYRTYLMMNYDTVNEKAIKKKNKERVDNLLDLSFNAKNVSKFSEIIDDEVKKYDNKAMEQSNVIGQLGVAIIAFFLTLFISIIFLAISFAKVIFSTFSLFLFLFLVFSWILSILPILEISVFKVFARTIGYIILSACMTFLFIVVSFCVDIADMFIKPNSKDAYFLNALFVVILIFILYKKRSQIIDFVTRGNVNFSPGAIGVAATNKSQQAWNKMRKKQNENKAEKRKRQQDKPTKMSKPNNESPGSNGKGSHGYKRKSQDNQSPSNVDPFVKSTKFNRNKSNNDSANRKVQMNPSGDVDSSTNNIESSQKPNYQKEAQQQDQTSEKINHHRVQRNEQSSNEGNQYQNKNNNVPKEVIRTEQRNENKAKQANYDNNIEKRQVQNQQNKQNVNNNRSQQPIERKPQKHEQSDKLKEQKDINKHGK